MSITTDAQDLFKQHNVAQLRDMILDEAGVAAPSKLRKHELAQYLADIRYNQAKADALAPLHEQPMAGSPAAIARSEEAAARLDKAVEKIPPAARAAAQALVSVAYGRYTAVVRSMGHTVRGKVVATELRTPDPDGSGRVLLVVQHDGHPHRRTLHRLVDVKLELVAS